MRAGIEGLHGEMVWNWDNSGNSVAGYPSIVYGWSPWLQNPQPSAKLPHSLSTLPSLAVNFDLSTQANGIYNTAFDLWITNTATPNSGNITNEVMIWVNRSGTSRPQEEFIERVTIGNTEYDLYGHPPNTNPWTYYAFVRVDATSSDSIDIQLFINHLLSNAYLSETDYLADIEFGHEVISGSGSTDVENYSVS